MPLPIAGLGRKILVYPALRWNFLEESAFHYVPTTSVQVFFGGERGIRTPGGLLTHTRFPGVRLKPLIHLSGARDCSSSTGQKESPPFGGPSLRLRTASPVG